jgi:hypothetical protein
VGIELVQNHQFTQTPSLLFHHIKLKKSTIDEVLEHSKPHQSQINEWLK